jgi:hypothetical protein
MADQETRSLAGPGQQEAYGRRLAHEVKSRSCDEPERATPLLSFGQVHTVIHPLVVLSNIRNKP